MNQQLKEAKRVIRSYWPQWSDAALAEAYAAAQDGKMPFESPETCLVGRMGNDAVYAKEWTSGESWEVIRTQPMHILSAAYNRLYAKGKYPNQERQRIIRP